MDNDVTGIVLQKLDKLQDGQDKMTETQTAILVELSAMKQERKTDRAEVENLVNRSSQEVCNHVETHYVSTAKFPVMFDAEFKKKKNESRETISFWQNFIQKTWDIAKIVLIVVVSMWAYTHGLLAKIF